MELTDALFTQHVNGAFKQYHSILALSRSPLANTALVLPALVRDAVSPTADERGHALRLVLRRAVSLLAPAPARYPFGADRPYDDPAWRDPRWWRYNILRHRYIEPLHPDEFVEGGRYTETLIALTGIPGPDTFFDERNRAIREVADWLRQQHQLGADDEALRHMALEEALAPLREQPAALALLQLAATFDDIFPRTLLLQLAADERLIHVDTALNQLIGLRLLLSDEDGAELWLSPVLRSYLYERLPAEPLRRRHELIARAYAASSDALAAADHWRRAGRWAEAAETLVAAAFDLVNELQISELHAALLHFRPGQLPPAQWRDLQVLLADLSLRLGRREEALAACRRALKVPQSPALQAQIYRRMGKLYEQHNQPHALGYYEQAAQRFPVNDPELVVLLKDRAWLYLLRREWAPAEADLTLALERAAEGERELRADILDALASLHRDQGRFAQAIECARGALSLREELGSLPRVADSLNNLGLLYNAQGDRPHALAAFAEALAIYRRLGNQERTAAALLNSGMAHHLAGRRRQAIDAYQECLAVADAVGLRLVQVRAHYNLAEALAELGEDEAARRYLLAAQQVSIAAGFDDELADLEELRARMPALQQIDVEPVAEPAPRPDPADALDPDERQTLDLAIRLQQITPKSLMAAANVSKATATRRLSELARRGLLAPQGKGRATAYVPVAHGAPPARPAPVEPAPTWLTQLFRQAQPLFATYGVRRLGQITAEPIAITRLVARFQRPPDLAGFFALERQLAALAGRPIDLLPEEALSDAERAGIVWG